MNILVLLPLTIYLSTKNEYKRKQISHLEIPVCHLQFPIGRETAAAEALNEPSVKVTVAKNDDDEEQMTMPVIESGRSNPEWGWNPGHFSSLLHNSGSSDTFRAFAQGD